MRKLSVFETVSIDGFFTDAKNDMSWAYGVANDPAFDKFTGENAEGGDTLLFGRVTYEMMAGFWPTPAAAQMNAKVAAHMNSLKKVVFSKSLTNPQWQNTTVIDTDLVKAAKKLKTEQGGDITVLGSGKIVSQLAQAGLVDEYQFVVAPIVLGSGRTVFDGITKRITLQMSSSRAFANGKVYTRYSVSG